MPDLHGKISCLRLQTNDLQPEAATKALNTATETSLPPHLSTLVLHIAPSGRPPGASHSIVLQSVCWSSDIGPILLCRSQHAAAMRKAGEAVEQGTRLSLCTERAGLTNHISWSISPLTGPPRQHPSPP